MDTHRACGGDRHCDVDVVILGARATTERRRWSTEGISDPLGAHTDVSKEDERSEYLNGIGHHDERLRWEVQSRTR